MASFAEVEKAIEGLATEAERGHAFEVFAEAWLANQPIAQAITVWPCDTVPVKLQSSLRLPPKDKGIDGVMETADGVTCYQVKFRTGRPRLRLGDLSTFFALSDRGCKRLVFTNCDEFVQEAHERPDTIFVRGADLDRLTPEDFRLMGDWINGAERPRARAQPRKHQDDAINAITRALLKAPRATALMACGTGKTLVGLWVAERMQCKTVLLLVPSLALMRQVVHAWLGERAVAYRCVCSDPSVVPEEDALVVTQADIDFPVTTDSQDVGRLLAAPSDTMKVVFSTYQSCGVIAAAMKDLPAFDLGIFDEAHKTAGQADGLFALALNDQRLPINRRLFLTATPRHVRVREGATRETDEPAYSMDSVDAYGEVAYRLPFSRAIADQIIADYKVVISVVTSTMVTDELLRRGVVSIETTRVRARQVANQLALKAAVERYGVRRIFSFHSSVASAESFASSGPEGVANHLQGFLCAHVNGAMAAGYREKIIREFANAPQALLSNARCLTEGVDVPGVDMVAFLSPRRSLVDIVQATGRAIRRTDGKSFGYVLVPLYVEHAREESIEDAVTRANFDDVWNILNRLREHDDLLAQSIDTMQTQRGEVGGYDDSAFRQRVEICGPPVSLEELQRSITAACVDALGKPWMLRYGQLVAYFKRHGTCDIPIRSKEYKVLATWIVAQRYERRKGRLTLEQIDLLDRIRFTWDPYSTEWRTNYVALAEYKAKHGNCEVPGKSREYPVLGRWVKQQRSLNARGELSEERVTLLNRIGFDWEARIGTWDQRFRELCAFKERFGNTRVPVKWKDSPILGNWAAAQRYKYRQGRVSARHVELLNSIQFEWEVPRAIPDAADWDEKLARFIKYREETGRTDFTRNDLEVRSIAGWVQAQRAARRAGKLDPERERRLGEIGFPWDSTTPGSEAHWRRRAEELRVYAQTHGTALVAATDKATRGLKEWVALHRSLRRRGRLSEQRIQLLDSIGFIWEPKRARRKMSAHAAADGASCSEMRAALVSYFKLHGNCHVPDSWSANPALARWVVEIRKLRGRDKLTADQISSLDALGFAWSAVEARWDEMLPRLKAAIRDGETPAVDTDLGRWIVAIRRQHRKGRLGLDKETVLRGIDFKLQPDGERWEAMLQRLKSYHTAHGDCLVPWKWEKDPQLSTWVRTQRYFRKNNLLSPSRIAALDELRFAWAPDATGRPKSEPWDDMLARLRRFAAEHGHTRVPQTFADDPKLANWVSTQRYFFRKGRLSADRIKSLNEAGFVWAINSRVMRAVSADTFGDRWQAMLEELRSYREKFGHCRVPSGWKENSRLANWVSVQRRAHKLHRLSPDRIAQLEAVGFVWSVPKVPDSSGIAAVGMDTWPDMIAQLKDFRAEYGHCRVPQRWTKNRRLAAWVDRMRRMKKQARFAAEYVAELDDLGFDWDPTTGKWEKMFAALEAFKHEHGHTNVPLLYAANPALGNWVRNQRRDRKIGREIMRSRIERLDSLGFVWGFTSKTEWEDMFAQLVAFKEGHGHCNVPQRWPENVKLGRWVNTQRWRASRLTSERRQMMEDLGFVWKASEGGMVSSSPKAQ